MTEMGVFNSLRTKKGYSSLEIVMELRDKHCLYLIKDKFGGSVKLRSGDNHLRYRLHHKTGMLNHSWTDRRINWETLPEFFN